MKQISTKVLAAVIAIVFLSLQAQAKIWRVNNTGIAADFSDPQQANDSAKVLAGDTIHIEPSTALYGGSTATISITKKLIIVGPGYFLGENLNQQSNTGSASIYRVEFNPGSEGSVIMGIIITNGLKITAGNIGVMRNRIQGNGITVAANSASFSNILISQNYIESGGVGASTGSSNISITNLIISNNYIASNGYCISFGINKPTIYGNISNNVLENTSNSTYTVPSVYNSVVSNNITLGNLTPQPTTNNNTYSNNIATATNIFPNINGNQNGINRSTLFVGSTGNSTDGQWKLKTGSPAIGAGTNGVDCGMYGGSNAYVLSGIPSVPTIYKLSVPVSSNGNQLPIIISTKSNN